ncbi:MAG: helix-turn-helix domain-containing protein [Pseudomonadota bacterium]
MSDTPRKRGRPATIDTQSAMHAVVELFRDKGYAAVSLDDLSEATGLSRPSLYRSFGNKLSMYVGAMNAFGQDAADLALPKLEAEGDLASALTNFFDAMLGIYYRDSEIAPGCLIFGTAPSHADEAEIKARLKFGIEQVDARMRARIERAFPTCDAARVETAARMASNTLIAFSARAKSGATRRQLSVMGAESARTIEEFLTAD